MPLFTTALGIFGGVLCIGVLMAHDSDHSNRAHSGPETTHSGSRYGLR
jgi:hypothetical protein